MLDCYSNVFDHSFGRWTRFFVSPKVIIILTDSFKNPEHMREFFLDYNEYIYIYILLNEPGRKPIGCNMSKEKNQWAF